MKLKQRMKIIFKSWKKKNPNTAHFENPKKMKENIYTEDTTLGDFFKRFHVVHYIFKYRVIVPLLWLSEWILKDVIIRKVPDKPWNVNFKIFDQAYEKSIIDWNILYRKGVDTAKPLEYWVNAAQKDKSCKLLRLMKEIMLTIPMYDTAYREFFNILFHNMGLEMLREYRNKDTGHLFFNSTDAYSVSYFNLFERVRVEKESFMKKAGHRDVDLTKDKNAPETILEKETQNFPEEISKKQRDPT